MSNLFFISLQCHLVAWSRFSKFKRGYQCGCYQGLLYEVVIDCVLFIMNCPDELKLESGKDLCILTPIMALRRNALPQLIEEVTVLRTVAIQF